MTDRPIIFSAPIVRALLDGRKTQTRRVLKPQPEFFDVPIEAGRGVGRRGRPGELWPFRCTGHPDEKDWQRWAKRAVGPYVPGDRLWVREAWRAPAMNDNVSPRDLSAGMARAFEADGVEIVGAGAHATVSPIGAVGKLQPSIFMPRWASRLTLGVVEVRVQRLLDITEQDAEAEGVCHFAEEGHGAGSFKGLHGADRAALVCSVYGSHREAFRHLWESLNGLGSWDANPWVAVISFTVHRANIDALDIGAAA